MKLVNAEEEFSPEEKQQLTDIATTTFRIVEGITSPGLAVEIVEESLFSHVPIRQYIARAPHKDMHAYHNITLPAIEVLDKDLKRGDKSDLAEFALYTDLLPGENHIGRAAHILRVKLTDMLWLKDPEQSRAWFDAYHTALNVQHDISRYEHPSILCCKNIGEALLRVESGEALAESGGTMADSLTALAQRAVVANVKYRFQAAQGDDDKKLKRLRMKELYVANEAVTLLQKVANEYDLAYCTDGNLDTLLGK